MTAWSFALVLAAGAKTLILPFENLGTDPSLSWQGSAFEEAVHSHMEAAHVDVIDVPVRNRVFRELGFAPDEPISRASAIVLAKEVSASRLVMGTYRPSEDRIDVEARIIDLDRGATVGVVEDYARPRELAELTSHVAKNLFRLELDSTPPGFDAHAERRSKMPLAALEASARARESLDAEEQERLLEQALEHEPSYLEARLLWGRLLYRSGQPRRAIEVLVGAGDDVALFARAYFDLGLSYLAVNEPALAQRVFNQLVQADPSRAVYANNLGASLLRLERFAEATEAFRHAVETGGRSPNPSHVFNLGWSLWRTGKGGLALQHLARAAELSPYDAEVHVLLAAAATSQAQPERAERARQSASVLAFNLEELDPATVTGLERVDETFEPVSLLSETQLAARGDGDDGLAELLSARALHADGRTDEAIQVLQRRLYRNPGANETRLELVELYRQQGELEAAERELSLVLWQDPNHAGALELKELLTPPIE